MDARAPGRNARPRPEAPFVAGKPPRVLSPRHEAPLRRASP